MTELERASKRMFGAGGIGVTNFSFTRGSNPNATPEQVAAEINKALDQIEAGTFEEVSPDDE